MSKKIWKILNFEKIITEIGNLKSQNLKLSEIITLVENLLKIIKYHQNLEVSKLKKTENSKLESEIWKLKNGQIENQKIEINFQSENSKIGSLEFENSTQLLTQLSTNLTLFVSSYDFLLWGLQPHLVQNKFYLNSKIKSNQKPILKKWANLLEIWNKIYKDLEFFMEIVEKAEMEILETGTGNYESQKLKNKTETSTKNQDLEILLAKKILKIGQNLNEAKPNQNCLLEVSKNFLEVKIEKSNFDLKQHFESVFEGLEKGLESDLEAEKKVKIEKLLQEKSIEKAETLKWQSQNKIDKKNGEIQELKEEKSEFGIQENQLNLQIKNQSNLEIKSKFGKQNGNQNEPQKCKIIIQSNLSRKDFVELLEICELWEFFENLEKGGKIEIQTWELSGKNVEISDLAEISMEHKTEEKKRKTQKNQFLESGKMKNPTKNEQGLEVLENNNFLKSVNLELFILEKAKICQQTGQNIGILCGQNSTLNDITLIATTKLNSQNYLILGESGSLTKIISKLDQKNSQLIILKNNNFLYLSNQFSQIQNPQNQFQNQFQNQLRNQSENENSQKYSKNMENFETKNLGKNNLENQNLQTQNQNQVENWQFLENFNSNSKIEKNSKNGNNSKLNFKLETSNKFSEIWFIGQPYIALDKFWQLENHQILKKFYWQSQINLLKSQNPNSKIGVIRSFWK